MAITWPAKNNYATGDVLTAANMNGIGDDLNALFDNSFYAGKNKIINADFGINQRSFTSTTTSVTYGFDRWQLLCAGGTSTYSAQTFTPGTAPVTGYESTNFARLVSTGQSAASDRTVLNQRIEDVRTFAGKTVTLSFWAKASSGTPSVAADIVQGFGTGGSTNVETGGQKTAITTSWARYSFTFNIASIAGKTIGTNNVLQVRLWTSAGSDYNSQTATLGVQSVTIDFWGVQLESGSVATPFQTATGTIQGELAACRRYFRLAGSGAFGQVYTTTNVSYMFQFDVQMRTTPTVTSTGQGNIVRFGVGIATTTTWSAGSVYGTVNGVGVDMTTNAVGYAAGDRVGLSNDSLQFNAEL